MLDHIDNLTVEYARGSDFFAPIFYEAMATFGDKERALRYCREAALAANVYGLDSSVFVAALNAMRADQ